MLPARFDDIGSNDILNLIENKIAERKTLEYKERLTIGNVDEKAEFLSDISSFANASGGDILFGISDERDDHGNATGLPDKVVGLNLQNPGQECGRIQQLIESGIQPRIPVVHVKSLEVSGVGTLIMIRIMKSWIGPHMVSYANRTRFFSRNSTGKIQLDVQQIGAAFAIQRSLGERLRAWKADRIAKVISGDDPILSGKVNILYHFISATSLTDEQAIVPRIFDLSRLARHIRLMSLSQDGSRYNADGFLISSRLIDYGRGSYLQIFRDGCLEYGDAYFLHNYDDVIPSQLFEENIVDTFSSAIRLVRELDAAEPLFVSLTLVGVKRKTMALPSSAMLMVSKSEPFDRSIISSPDIRVENISEESPFNSTLSPIIDSIWQAAGMKHSPYRQNGIWNPRWRQVDRYVP